MSVISTGGYLTKATSPITLASAAYSLVFAFRYSGTISPSYEVTNEIYQGGNTYFELYRLKADGHLWGFWRNSGGTGVDTDFGADSTWSGKWIHGAWTVSAAGSAHLYLATEGFNRSSPSYIATPSNPGTVQNLGTSIAQWIQGTDTTGIAQTIAFARTILCAKELSEAEVIAAWGQEAPTAAITAVSYSLLAQASSSTPEVDTGSTASNWTKTSTFAAGASAKPMEWTGPPDESLGSFRARPSRPTPQSRLVDVVAPIGALLAAGGLTSVAWGAATPLPPRPTAPRPPEQVVAPIGTATFALPKLGYALATVHPPRGLTANRPPPDTYSPVGTLLTPSPSLGWLQIDGTPPASRSLVISAVFGDELQRLATSLPSLGWLTCDAPPRAATVRAQPSESAPTSPLRPFVSASTGWFPAEYRTPPQVFARPQPSAPTGPLRPFVSLSTGWFDAPSAPSRSSLTPARVSTAEPVGSAFASQGLTSLGWLLPLAAPSLIPKPRAQEPAQPTGPLAPFVSLSTGWMGFVPVPYDTPLAPPRASESAPVGVLLTPQPFGWNAPHQGRPAPVVPRKVEPAAPVGTPFAIALPSNGWLATDNPRTPLKLSKSTPTDPVGNLLVLPPLPNLTWLVTENPRTPYVTHGAVPVDPVGTAFPFLARLGPYWFVEQPRRAPAQAIAPAPSAPIGALFSTLSSVGWFAPPAPPKAISGAPQVYPQNPLGELRFGGSPWADITSAVARVAAGRRQESAEPVGSPLSAAGLTSLGWVAPELARRAPAIAPALLPAQHLGIIAFGGAPWTSVDVVRAQRANPPALIPSEPVGDFMPPPAPSTSVGWMQAMDLPPKAQVFSPMAVEIASVVAYPVAHVPATGPVVGVWRTVTPSVRGTWR
jgi:hypothetical protein